ENSREYKLTPWYNDPVLDPHGEVIYLIDEITGDKWTITPHPAGNSGVYYIRHGFGYSTFESASCELKSELTMFVPKEDSVKINLIKLKNTSRSSRKIQLVYYIRPVLGVTDEATSQYIASEFDKEERILYIRNVYNEDFVNRIAFLATSEGINSYESERGEFIGVGFDLSSPQA
ncbi:MAG: hypothetical protein ACPLSA_04230, partial [Caldanaerobacter sp.]